MGNSRRIIMVTVFAFLCNSVLLAAPKQDQTILQQRFMRYSSRPTSDATTWQKDVRAKLFQLLKMNKSLQGRSSIPFSAKELSHIKQAHPSCCYHTKLKGQTCSGGCLHRRSWERPLQPL